MLVYSTRAAPPAAPAGVFLEGHAGRPGVMTLADMRMFCPQSETTTPAQVIEAARRYAELRHRTENVRPGLAGAEWDMFYMAEAALISIVDRLPMPPDAGQVPDPAEFRSPAPLLSES